jgi:type I restriction enzyme M protein
MDNQKTEILFIERCIDFLKPATGRMAIVLPDGILTNSSLQYVRDFLMEHSQILAVVSLPQFSFSHYGAGVKSSLVFVRKLGEDEKPKRYKIFMAIAEHIGYDATGRKDKANDLNTIYDEYAKLQK